MTKICVGCGECMNESADSPSVDYCEECFQGKKPHVGDADWYTRRMENGWTE